MGFVKAVRLLRVGSLMLPVLLAGQTLEAPLLPDGASAIEVKAAGRVRLKYHFLAVGTQTYQCQNGAWSKDSTPSATLTELNSGMKVHHSAGPLWATSDGKSSIKAIGRTAVHFAAPDGVSIDWLKLDADRTSRSGEFRDVGNIQRLYTGAGKAPAAGCRSNESYVSQYTAHYFFWTSGE